MLVTGAASGMGRATAHVFASEGAVVAVTDINEDGNRERRRRNQVRRRQCARMATRCDGSRRHQTRSARSCRDRFRRLDILDQQRRLRRRSHPLDGPEYDKHLGSHHHGIADRAAAIGARGAAYLRKSDAARIVNIASTEGLGATPGDTPYVVAKTGVIGLTRGLAVDLGPEGITVNCICPGPIRTALTEAIPEEHKTIFGKRRTALKRYGFPEEVAHMTVSLCLPAASYLTGAVIPVDGGLTIRNA